MNDPPSPPHDADARHAPGLVVTLGVLICLSALAIDVNMPALPLVAADLGARAEVGPWIVSTYLAGYASGQIPIGLLGDRYGRRPLLLAGLVLFVLASVVTCVVTDAAILLGARFVQGIAGAIGPVLGRAIVRDISTGIRAAQLMAIMVTLLGVSTLVAPLLGSGLLALSGWRATFAFSVVLGVLTLALVHRFVPETRPGTSPPAGAGRQLAASISAFTADPRCLWGTGLVGLAFGGYMTVVAASASIIVGVYDLDASATGPFFAVATLGYIGGAWISRRRVAGSGVLAMLRTAIVAFALASCALAVIAWAGSVGLGVLCAAVTLYMLGIGLLLPNATAIALEPLPQAAGFGASIIGTAQIGSGALVSLLAAPWYAGDVRGLAVVMSVAGVLTVALFLLGHPRGHAGDRS